MDLKVTKQPNGEWTAIDSVRDRGGGVMLRRPKIRMQRCFYCDAPIGIYSDADADDFDSCQKIECRCEAVVERRDRQYEEQDWEAA
jgi:hypothetical protein